MKIICNCCEQWTELPSTGGSGAHAQAACLHCAAPLAVDDYYRLCPHCGHFFLAEYEVCPACAAASVQAAEAPSAPARGLSKRKARGGDYYWQVYFDYQSSAASSAPASNASEPVYRNGNGHTATGAAANGHGAPAQANGHSNGYTNGHGIAAAAPANGSNGKQNGHAAPAHHAGGSTVDLAVSDPVPLTLFPEEEVKVYVEETDAPVKVSAGAFNEFEYELIQDPSRLAEVAEILASEKIVGIDTETTGLDPHTVQLLLLQISTLDKVYVVDCKRVLPLALKPFLEDPGVLKVAQNAKFEYEMLKQQAGITITSLFDTMLAERIMTAGISREISLKLIAEKYIGAVLDKSVRESFYKTSHIDDAYLAPEQLHYAARDAFIMIPIQQRQVPELKKHKLTQVAELEFKCIAAVGDLELAGVRIDEERWRGIIADVAVQRDKSAAELCEILAPATMQATMFGVPAINLNSNVQLIEAFSKLGVDLPDTMEATLVKYDHAAVRKLLEYRGHEKTLSAFGENVLGLINPKTHRIHPDFNQHGADTGRFSCTRPNVQQIPATSDFRKCFVPAPGYRLVTCVAESTRVATARGLIPIEQVVQGDYAVQEDGSTRLVQRVIDQGERLTLTVRTALGYELTATPEHRVRVLNSHGDYVWQELANLEPGSTVAIKTDGGFERAESRISIPDVRVAHFNAINRSLPPSISEELSLLLGYITGDGTFIDDYIGWVVNKHDADVADLPCRISAQLFSYKPREYAYRGVIDQRIYSKQIKQWLEGLGASKHHVPGFLWSASADLVAAYLRGLFESDGSVQSTSTGKISFSTVHEELAREVHELICALGVAAVRAKLEHGKGCGYIWMVTIPSAWNKAFQERVGFISARKRGELAALLERKVKQEHGAMPHLGSKAYEVVHMAGVSSATNRLLANVRNRNSVMTMALAERVRSQAPQVADYLGLHHLLDPSIIFDHVVEVRPSGTHRVYDLTVEGTSTYVTRGFVSHNCDYSQAELRILAELSGDEGFVNAFKSGGDLHALTASQMFGVPLDQVQKPQRSAAKSINFGLAYGRGPGSLAVQLGVSPDEAKDLIAKYFKAYPGVQKWLDKAAKDAVRTGYSVTTIGRKRFYTLPDESLRRNDPDEYRRQIGSIERQGKNSPIQGGNADMTKLALINLRTALKDWDARTVNTVHDEIVVEVRADQAEEVKEIVEREMVSAGESILKNVPIVADATLADYWSK